MAAGTITTLGLGSGLDLQNILDQLKESEMAPINAKESRKSELQGEIRAYNSLNAKLFSLKSDALNLSLESEFLKTKIAVSDDDILTASADDGIAESSHTIEVIRKARYNSWQSDPISGSTDVIYPEPQTGITSKTGSVTTEDETMTILYGALEDQQEININLDAGMSLTQIAETVNSSAGNTGEDGAQLVKASVEENNGEFYIRLSAASGGDSADSQISVAGFDYVKADTAISIGVAAGGDPMFLSVAPGTTYGQMADAINNASDNPGVTASIVDTGASDTPYRFTLTSDATGEDNRISIQNLSLTEVTGADGDSLNAALKVNGIEYQRQSNENISDVISGVSLNLKKTGETSVGVQKNLETVKENIISLVDGYNELLAEVNGTEGTGGDNSQTEDTSESPLSDSYEVKNVLSELKSLITSYVSSDNEYTSMVDLGLSVNKDGTMTLDQDKLDQAVASNPSAVQSLFIGDADAGITGLGDLIDDGITDMVSSQGIVSTNIDEAETRMDRLEKDIQTATERLNKRYEILTAQFVRLDSYISQLNNESEFMQSMIDSLDSSKSE